MFSQKKKRQIQYFDCFEIEQKDMAIMWEGTDEISPPPGRRNRDQRQNDRRVNKHTALVRNKHTVDGEEEAHEYSGKVN